MRLLVTGFGPFPNMPRNPSAALARRVAASPRWRLLGIEVTCRTLTTAYSALATELDPALAKDKPDAVLMIGVAGRSTRIRIESRGTSRRSMLFPDVSGKTAAAPASGGHGQRWTRLPPVKALRALRRQALPSRISRDAGRYLCNASYFRALALPVPVLFVHIPKPHGARPWTGAAATPRLSYDQRLGAALVEIGGLLLERARSSAIRPASTLSLTTAERSS
jgi:pyroglutamyl-peptidase